MILILDVTCGKVFLSLCKSCERNKGQRLLKCISMEAVAIDHHFETCRRCRRYEEDCRRREACQLGRGKVSAPSYANDNTFNSGENWDGENEAPFFLFGKQTTIQKDQKIRQEKNHSTISNVRLPKKPLQVLENYVTQSDSTAKRDKSSQKKVNRQSKKLQTSEARVQDPIKEEKKIRKNLIQTSEARLQDPIKEEKKTSEATVQDPIKEKKKTSEATVQDPIKEEKKIKKKLKQIEALEKLQMSGKKLNSEELQKVSKKSELNVQLKNLQLH